MEWLDVAKTLGVPVMCMCVLAYAIWKVGVWIGTYFLRPLVERHMAFVDKLSVSVESMTSSMKDLAMQREADTHNRIEELDKLDHIADKLSVIAQGISEVKTLVVSPKNVVIQTTPQEAGKHDPAGR